MNSVNSDNDLFHSAITSIGSVDHPSPSSFTHSNRHSSSSKFPLDLTYQNNEILDDDDDDSCRKKMKITLIYFDIWDWICM
jgi:hypothetical protein